MCYRMRYGKFLSSAALVACTLLGSRLALADKYDASANLTDKDYAEIEINIGTPEFPILTTHKIETMMGLRHSHVQLQERDFSCGAASLTSIFNFYLDYPTKEVEVIQGLLALAKSTGTLEKIIQRRGFTLLDLKKYAEAQGFTTSAFKLEFDDLVELGEPALVPIIPGGYKHFVVFRGADDKYVYLADPSFGNLTQTIEEFKRDWYGFTNVALIVHRREDQDKDHRPPLQLSKVERFDSQTIIDSFLDVAEEFTHGPLVTTEW